MKNEYRFLSQRGRGPAETKSILVQGNVKAWTYERQVQSEKSLEQRVHAVVCARAGEVERSQRTTDLLFQAGKGGLNSESHEELLKGSRITRLELWTLLLLFLCISESHIVSMVAPERRAKPPFLSLSPHPVATSHIH